MDRQYDIFERLPDGSVIWRTSIPGLENALAELKKFSQLSPNEFFVFHSPTNETIARINASALEQDGSG
jgi:hypothetical protein